MAQRDSAVLVNSSMSRQKIAKISKALDSFQPEIVSGVNPHLLVNRLGHCEHA